MELDTQCDKTIVNNLTQANQLFILFSAVREEFLRNDVERLFEQLFKILWEKMGIRLTAGISSARNALTEESIKEAKEAFLQKMIFGRSGLYFYQDIKALHPAHVPASELNILRQYVEKHQISDIEFFINEHFSDERIKRYNISYMRILWLRIIDIILKTEDASFVKDAKNVEKMVLNYEILVSFHSLKEFRGYLYSLILESIQTEGGFDIKSKSKIKLAIKYIQDNYNQDIAINDMADKFNMSPNYFSAVFKRETGQTTVNFIKDLRLKKACEYLTHSDKSVVEISKEVGYEDSQYFFKVFKKATGLTPLQYRKMHM
jgi:YesN/AraC family two-component response regulator